MSALFCHRSNAGKKGKQVNQDDTNFKLDRDIFDRRSGHHLPPPYLTDEGFVLIDRRATPERRADARQGVVVNLDSTIKTVRR